MKYFILLLILGGFIETSFALEYNTDKILNESFEKNLPTDIKVKTVYFCNNPKENDSLKEEKWFWSTLHIRLLSMTPEFQSLDGKRDSITIEEDTTAMSCPPPRTILYGTFTSTNGEEHKYHLEYNSDTFNYRIDDIFPPQYPNFIEPPLKQFRIWNQLDIIQSRPDLLMDVISCKENLVLVLKSNNNPACVKLETKTKLIERKWSRSDSPLINIGTVDTDIIQEKRQLEKKIIASIQNDRLINITNDQAEQIVFEEWNWNSSMLKDKEVEIYLLHVKNDGFAFLVDENSLEDKELVMSKFPEIAENLYLWMVTISLDGGGNREWSYMINASDGSIIKSTDETMNLFEPIDPSESIKNQITVRQAIGDVTIVFPKGVSETIPKYSPLPAQLLVSQGDTVIWTNEDSVPHTVTSVSETGNIGKSFDSGIISPGQSFSHMFEEYKEYRYACLVHPWMNGGIVVQKIER